MIYCIRIISDEKLLFVGTYDECKNHECYDSKYNYITAYV